MTKRFGDKQRLEHMLAAIDDILSFTKDVTEAEFNQNRMMQFACVRGLEIIGEAANHVTSGLRLSKPHIMWHNLIGMRNFAAHQYFDLRNDILWQTISQDLSALKPQLQQLHQALSASVQE